jgi:hypothetical protein
MISQPQLLGSSRRTRASSRWIDSNALRGTAFTELVALPTLRPEMARDYRPEDFERPASPRMQQVPIAVADNGAFVLICQQCSL